MEKVEKGIYPVEDGNHYGEVLFGYTDMEEAKNAYKEQTGEDLDVENCQEVNVEVIEKGEEFGFSWEAGTGTPSIICIY